MYLQFDNQRLEHPVSAHQLHKLVVRVNDWGEVGMYCVDPHVRQCEYQHDQIMGGVVLDQQLVVIWKGDLVGHVTDNMQILVQLFVHISVLLDLKEILETGLLLILNPLLQLFEGVEGLVSVMREP